MNKAHEESRDDHGLATLHSVVEKVSQPMSAGVDCSGCVKAACFGSALHSGRVEAQC